MFNSFTSVFTILLSITLVLTILLPEYEAKSPSNGKPNDSNGKPNSNNGGSTTIIGSGRGSGKHKGRCLTACPNSETHINMNYIIEMSLRALKLKCVGMEHLEQCELYTIQSLLRLTVIWEFVHLVHDPAKSKVYFVVNGQYKPLSPIFVQVRSQLSLIRNLLHTLTTDQQHDLERCLAWKTVFDMRKSRNQRGGDTGENDSKSSLPRESNLDFGSNMLTDDLLVHRIFVLVCNVADQFEAHFAGEMRHIAKTAADMALSVSQPVDIGGKENEQCFANANNPSTSTEILEQPSNAEETEQPTPLPANNKPRRLLASWVPDDQCKNCTKCKRKFTRFRRRHHCRQCGQIFCGKCAKKKIFLVQLNGKVRVCDLGFHQEFGRWRRQANGGKFGFRI
ncbi:FYVE zinc finger domain-containing protein [Ditylenchus destructor]|uniref:FYVE zinc finger domain-containing protein n=1 Tax=Ditylenchus destructor TaxID=166010 RepID=A0AAD4MY21_9BILA|nr:FYVE zinc finger domain-containing protein [Ditylenchus destructor]